MLVLELTLRCDGGACDVGADVDRGNECIAFDTSISVPVLAMLVPTDIVGEARCRSRREVFVL